ncbi:hypothetical protein [Halorubrum sp. AS12]|uniref:hypothetical protein n=1 Tax=Halorubrum sp. AS12 TaxID=3409687 RepID=UPI003DA78518
MLPAAKAPCVSRTSRAAGPALTLRENGPALLVPAAWGVAAGAVLGVVSAHALFVAHVVMGLLLVAFVAASWRDMATGVLRAWKLAILAGTLVTLAGAGTVPALAAACSVAGAAAAALAASATGVVAGVALVGIGQTAGILAATALYPPLE